MLLPYLWLKKSVELLGAYLIVEWLWVFPYLLVEGPLVFVACNGPCPILSYGLLTRRTDNIGKNVIVPDESYQPHYE